MEEKEKFDIADLLRVIPGDKVKFSAKGTKKNWDSAEIITLGFLIKIFDKQATKNPELKKELEERLNRFEKAKYEVSKDIPEQSEEQVEIERIKLSKDTLNFSRLSSIKKLSPKTKKLIQEAWQKAMQEKVKKANIIVGNDGKKTEVTSDKELPSDKEVKEFNKMLDIAVKSGVIDKKDLGIK